MYLLGKNFKVGKGLKALTYIQNFMRGRNAANHNQMLNRTQGIPLSNKWKNLCPNMTADCYNYCIETTGRNNSPNAVNARYERTALFTNHTAAYFDQLEGELRKGMRAADKQGLPLAVRLNGTSDIRWEEWIVRDGKNIFELYPSVIFYDYTKLFDRHKVFSGYYPNYTLTFSYDGKSNHYLDVMHRHPNVNISVVFDKRMEMPKEWMGRRVINGGGDDERFADPKGVIVGLPAVGVLGNAKISNDFKQEAGLSALRIGGE